MDLKRTFNDFFKEWTDADSQIEQDEARKRIEQGTKLLARLDDNISDHAAWEGLVEIGYASKTANGSRGGNYRETNKMEDDKRTALRSIEAITREMNDTMDR